MPPDDTSPKAATTPAESTTVDHPDADSALLEARAIVARDRLECESGISHRSYPAEIVATALALPAT